jgi:hypothetical protein
LEACNSFRESISINISISSGVGVGGGGGGGGGGSSSSILFNYPVRCCVYMALVVYDKYEF